MSEQALDVTGKLSFFVDTIDPQSKKFVTSVTVVFKLTCDGSLTHCFCFFFLCSAERRTVKDPFQHLMSKIKLQQRVIQMSTAGT